MSYSIKSIKEHFKSQGIYHTSVELAMTLKKYIPDDVNTVYDPTCGHGALLSVFSDEVRKYGQELDEHQIEVARDNLVNFTGVAGDTLKNPAFMDMKFDAIVANYPFSIKWEPPREDIRFPVIVTQGRADYAFIFHCLHLLSYKGTAAILSFPGVLYRGGREKKAREWLIDNNYIERVVAVPGDSFEDTKIPTAILVLRKNKKTTDVIFQDLELNEERVVGIDEIKSNDYSLSVSNYVFKEVIEEVVDPVALEMEARELVVKRLDAEIKFSSMVAEFEGLDLNIFLDELQCVIEKWRNK